MKPTLNDIARQTDLSVATVSRALHRSDSPNVSVETRRRVHEVARRLGYRPNLMGRSLATGRSHTVSYWTFDAFTPYYAMVGRYIYAEAVRRGFTLIVNSTPDPSRTLEPEQHALRDNPALHTGFDGMIACDVAFRDNDYAAELRSLGMPFVGIGLNYATEGDYVGLNLYDGSVAAVRHLLDAGAQRIAVLCWPDGVGRDPRAQAYIEVMTEVGRPMEWIELHGSHRRAARQAIIAYAEKRGIADLPDAIFCVNDEAAVGCYRGLCDLGLRVPEDVMLMGCDGIEETEYLPCPISTIVAPVRELCEAAWDILEARIREPNAPTRQVVLETTLAVRESTRRPKMP